MELTVGVWHNNLFMGCPDGTKLINIVFLLPSGSPYGTSFISVLMRSDCLKTQTRWQRKARSGMAKARQRHTPNPSPIHTGMRTEGNCQRTGGLEANSGTTG